VCIAFAVACVGATLYEIPNGRLIWRCALSGRSSNSALGKDNVASAVSDKVIATDPETGDILTYCLGDPNDQDLGDLVARHPRNEFFLAQLAERLLDVNCIDRQAALTLADELVAISPENAHYRYLKGWILLKPPRDLGREQKALEQFELGNSLSQFYLPYSRYKERVDRLCDRADISLLDRNKAHPSETGMYFDLAVFISRSQGPYATLGSDALRDLSVPVVEIGKRLINNGQTFGQFEHGMFLLRLTEAARLRKLSLPPQQAWQSRLHLGQAMALNEMLQGWYLEAFTSGVAIMKKGLVAVVPLALGLQLPFMWLFMVIVNLLRGRADLAPVGIKAYVLFILGLVSFHGLLVLVALLNKLLPGSSLASIVFMAGPMFVGGVLWLLAHVRPVDHTRFRRGRLWAAVVCGLLWALGLAVLAIDAIANNPPDGLKHWLVLAGVVLGWSALWTIFWAVAAYRQHVFRAVPYDGILRMRIVQTTMLLLMATGIITLVWAVPVVPTVLSFVTLLLVGTIAVHSTEHRIIFWDALRRFFAKRGRMVVTRTKLAHLISAVLLVCWLAILVGVHLSADKWQRLETMRTDPLALYGPLPQATQETYERMVLASQPEKTHYRPWDQDAGVPEHIHLAAPADVTAFLAKRQTEGRPLSDTRLLRLAVQGGRDIRPVVLGALNEPNTLEALLKRAEWGDSEVKEQLVAHFEREFTELGEPYTQIRQDPNCLQGLIMKARWGNEDAKSELERRFAVQMTRLVNAPAQVENRDRLRSALGELVTINEALISLSKHGHIGRFMRRNHERSDLLERLLIDADMLDVEPSAQPSDVTAEQLELLLDIAEALTFISEPQEAKARFQWLMAPLLERQRQDHDLRGRSRPRSSLSIGFATCLFYRAMKGVPQPETAALLKEYVKRSQVSDPFEETEFLDILGRAGDRALAEWVLQKVAASPPSKEVRDIPVGRIINIAEDFETHREDTSYEYLEAAFAHLTTESMPLLLAHLDSDNEQLRAFVVWRLTSLEHDWPKEQVHTLLADSNWKIRLNTLFACDPEDLATAITDNNSIVRAVAHILINTQ